MSRFSGLCGLAVLLSATASAQSIHAPLLKGDRAYDREQYKAAEKHYRIAADRDVGNAQAVYNLGNTLYQQGNWEDSEQRFRQAAGEAKTPARQADALHNLGNAFLQQKRFQEAVRAYEESLRHRPADPDTKQNLQMAKKMLREEEQKQQEQEQQKQQEQNKEQPQDPNQPKQQNPQDQPENQQPQPNEQGQKPEQQQQEQQRQQQEQQGKIKKEEAKHLLETAIGPEDRKNAQKYRAAQQQQSKPKGSKKDW
ncbi:MAG: tetratricopeptide repeat protein [Saprospiraceae bacterium]